MHSHTSQPRAGKHHPPHGLVHTEQTRRTHRHDRRQWRYCAGWSPDSHRRCRRQWHHRRSHALSDSSVSRLCSPSTKPPRSPAFTFSPISRSAPDAVEKRISFMSNIGDLIFFVARFHQLLLYAAFSQGLFCASSIRNRSSISENDSVRLNFSDTFPGRACSSSIRSHSSG